VHLIAIFIALLTFTTACNSDTPESTIVNVMESPFFINEDSVTLMELNTIDKRPMVVNLWATWCAPCLEEMPDLEIAHRAHSDAIRFIGINISDSPTKANKTAADLKITYLLGRDPKGDLVTALGSIGLPVTVFVNSSGVIDDIHYGPISSDQLKLAMQEYLK
tara:strand:+ start:646 stop:1134 length:489 start_codon:yes stop_codon:yes gene_type:complete